MRIPSGDDLLERVRALPSGALLFERLPDATGVYLVGGAVRDLLLGGRPLDLDLVVEGDVAPVAARLGRPRVHERFGTATVQADGFTYDLARARRETYRRPGALPDVTPAGIEEDLQRRDFTVNALALALGGESPGRLHHPPDALEDLAARQLRVLHDRSFVDDPTRLLRLARYRARLRFGVEPRTLALAREAVARDALSTVSGTRIGNELRLLAREGDPVGALAAVEELGLDAAVAPGFAQAPPELARDALELLPADGRPDVLVLGWAFEPLAAGERTAALEHLGFSAAQRVAVEAVAHGRALAAKLAAASASPAEIAKVLAGQPPEAVAFAGALGPAPAAQEWLGTLRHIALQIAGSDLLAAGVPPGPAIGRGLEAALRARLEGRARTREDELAEALRVLSPD